VQASGAKGIGGFHIETHIAVNTATQTDDASISALAFKNHGDETYSVVRGVIRPRGQRVPGGN
jgi:hypothetical protein